MNLLIDFKLSLVLKFWILTHYINENDVSGDGDGDGGKSSKIA